MKVKFLVGRYGLHSAEGLVTRMNWIPFLLSAPFFMSPSLVVSVEEYEIIFMLIYS